MERERTPGGTRTDCVLREVIRRDAGISVIDSLCKGEDIPFVMTGSFSGGCKGGSVNGARCNISRADKSS